MILHTESLKDSIGNIRDNLNCRIQNQCKKYVIFLYINNYSPETKHSYLQFHENNTKTSINLIKEVNDLNIEHYKTLMKETEENINI